MSINDNTTEEGKAANRAAYARYAPALAEWRANIGNRIAQMAKCQHVYHVSGGIDLCKHCGQPKKLAEMEE